MGKSLSKPWDLNLTSGPQWKFILLGLTAPHYCTIFSIMKMKGKIVHLQHQLGLIFLTFKNFHLHYVFSIHTYNKVKVELKRTSGLPSLESNKVPEKILLFTTKFNHWSIDRDNKVNVYFDFKRTSGPIAYYRGVTRFWSILHSNQQPNTCFKKHDGFRTNSMQVLKLNWSRNVKGMLPNFI